MTYDLAIWTNATFTQQFQYLESDGVTPIDLTGYTAVMDVKASPSSAVIVSLTSSSGVTMDSTGHINLLLPYSITSTLPPGIYQYDLILTTGIVRIHLIGGAISIFQGITP